MIGTQLTMCADALRHEVVPVRNDKELPLRKKPQVGTGLWTSTYREESRDSAWVEWCRDVFGIPDTTRYYLLTPRTEARLYVVDGEADLRQLLRDYPYKSPLVDLLNATASPFGAGYFTGIDFERLAQDYDGLHLSRKGERATHLSFPQNLNSWDCESTIWFRWCFEAVQEITPTLSVEVGE